MKSLYVFNDKNFKTEELAKRWWVDPKVAYVYKLGGDVQVILQLSKTSEEYVVTKIAARINKENMCEDY